MRQTAELGWGFCPTEFPYTGAGTRERVLFEGRSERRFSSQLSDKRISTFSTHYVAHSYFMLFLDDALKEDGAYNLADLTDIVKNL